jgi:hypothetical protein
MQPDRAGQCGVVQARRLACTIRSVCSARLDSSRHVARKRQSVTPPSTQPTIERPAHCRHCVTRREPSKLPSAPSSKPGVESIANINRIVPAVIGEARVRQGLRRDVADAIAAHVTSQSLPLPPSFESMSGHSRSSTAHPSHSSTVVLRFGVTPAHRQLRMNAAQSDRRRRSAIRIALTLVNNGGQHQRRPHIVVDSKAPGQSRYCAGCLS